MAVGEDEGQPLEGTPDMIDVRVVIVNVETRAGKQYAFVVGPERESERVSVEVDTQLWPERGIERWTFVVKRVASGS